MSCESISICTWSPGIKLVSAGTRFFPSLCTPMITQCSGKDRIENFKMPGNLRYQNNGSQRRALNSHQESRHGYQHDISDAFVSDNAVLHCNQSHKPPQQATCDQSGDKVSPGSPEETEHTEKPKCNSMTASTHIISVLPF